jgi:lipopolysaccharide transport system ATP-binding protein
MFARLAFAVAAHMEPDILLVDEVLAVGDVEFQKKCLGKMGQVASGGRTVLFVSHNMGTVAQLCSRALLLESGRLKQVGEPHLVIEQYLASFAPNVQSLPEGMGRTGTGAVRVQDLSLLSGRGERTHSILSGEDLVIRISVRSMREKVRFVVSIHICDEMGTPIIYSCDQGSLFAVDGKGELIIEATLGSLYLAPGVYFVSIVLDRSGCEIYDKVTNAARFEVNQGPRVPLQDVWHRGWGAVFSPPRFRVLRHELPRPLQEGHRRPLRS